MKTLFESRGANIGGAASNDERQVATISLPTQHVREAGFEDVKALQALFASVVGTMNYVDRRHIEAAITSMNEDDLKDFIAFSGHVALISFDTSGLTGFVMGEHISKEALERQNWRSPEDTLVLQWGGVRPDLRGVANDNGFRVGDMLISRFKNCLLPGFRHVEYVVAAEDTQTTRVFTERYDFKRVDTMTHPGMMTTQHRLQYTAPKYLN